jgi:hypothetical protein
MMKRIPPAGTTQPPPKQAGRYTPGYVLNHLLIDCSINEHYNTRAYIFKRQALFGEEFRVF